MTTLNKNNSVKTCSFNHQYEVEKATSLGCPVCLSNWLDMGLTMD